MASGSAGVVPLLVLVLAGVAPDISSRLVRAYGLPPAARWPNSSDGMHTFLTFDSKLTAAEIQHNPNASRLDYVWGAAPEHIPAYRASANPDTVLSSYIPFCRDPNRTLMKGCTGPTPAECPGLRWYQENRPDFIAYQCDRTTPAWEHYDGEGWAETALIPLDLSNPDVIQWQVDTMVQRALANGYDAIAWDNFGLTNNWRACGAYRRGKWVQQYTNSTHDAAYAQAIVQWLGRVRQLVNALTTKRGRPMLVIPNWSLGEYSWDDDLILAVGNRTDGVLSEAGFSGYGCVGHCTTGDAWEQRLRFATNLQQHGVAYYAINEIGDARNPARWHEPCSQDPLNCITPDKRLYVIASVLLANQGASAVYISPIQGYGGASDCPECSAPVGTPIGMPAREQGIWLRNFTAAVVLLNNNPNATATVALDPGFAYRSLDGRPAQGPVVLSGGNATILLRTRK